MSEPSQELVASVRASSRQLVRELGFMGQTIAGTDLPASSVHAILELGSADNISATGLAEKLLLEKSTVSRLVANLKSRGLIAESRSTRDARMKHLSLTNNGRRTLEQISQFAGKQVSAALLRLDRTRRGDVATALAAYSNALQQCRLGCAAHEQVQAPEIMEGYTPGMIGQIAALHGTYYARETGFGAPFEAKVASGVAEFVPRLERPVNQIWHVRNHGQILGSIAIDGEDLGDGTGHLRWFFVGDGLRGMGTGRALLAKALDFCDQRGFTETHLWTFSGLDAARRLYEQHGFVLVEEYPDDQWGKQVLEQKFVRPLKARH